jgi:UDP-hydrolysing UDP-N-acetyl-D-glucosamine 2-epimerase
MGVVTVSRSDYGIYQPVLERIRDDPDLALRLFVGGMHLSPEFGLTVREIEADGFEVAERVEMLVSSDTPEGVALSMGIGTMGFARAYARVRPDILVVLGDRFEMHSAAVAAVPFCIPIAHIHGGESTLGAIDEQIRHSITKLSHVHFVATEAYASRVLQMGEEPWRVVVCGAPSLDKLRRFERLTPEEIHRRHGVVVRDGFLLVTYHPVTLACEDTGRDLAEMLSALEDVGRPLMFTYPGADTGSRTVIATVSEFVKAHPDAQLVTSLGWRAYFSLMAMAAGMVGNSSSGIIEAGSFALPVVNIGGRQSGRAKGPNVIDVECDREAISEGIKRGCSASFRKGLQDVPNLYGDGHASERIVERLKNVSLDRGLLVKRFHAQA